jgi:hypothetical protein
MRERGAQSSAPGRATCMPIRENRHYKTTERAAPVKLARPKMVNAYEMPKALLFCSITNLCFADNFFQSYVTSVYT